MRSRLHDWSLVIALGCCSLTLHAQCPKRPASGTVVQDPFAISSQNGALKAAFVIKHSVDDAGYTHYCLNYDTGSGIAEAPTLRVNQGDNLVLDVKDRIEPDQDGAMTMPAGPGKACGDGGNMTINTVNLHYHGMNISPKCHQDDVITTLIQPGTPGFRYNIRVPKDEPPGLYWYHPHVHGFAEFHVNGGAAGALIVEGMERLRPEVAGLTERVFVLRQQYLVPWIPGPYQLTLNYQIADYPNSQGPIVQMKPHEKQFWRVANATLQDFMPLQVQVDGVAQKVQLIALDGYPLKKPRFEDTILVPPASRAEFIVEAPGENHSVVFVTNFYSTGPTGNPDLFQRLATIQVTPNAAQSQHVKTKPAASEKQITKIKYSDLASQETTTLRKLYFSEEFGGTNGPIQFYITVDGQKEKVFDPNEKPVITTHVGAVEDWIVENRALETHAFHMHQIHFLVTEVDGVPVKPQDLRDTIEIPFWEGTGHPYHKVKMRMDFRDPTIAGTFLFHCHILLHEDLGMMHKILVKAK